jgi:hypothetical protein
MSLKSSSGTIGVAACTRTNSSVLWRVTATGILREFCCLHPQGNPPCLNLLDYQKVETASSFSPLVIICHYTLHRILQDRDRYPPQWENQMSHVMHVLRDRKEVLWSVTVHVLKSKKYVFKTMWWEIQGRQENISVTSELLVDADDKIFMTLNSRIILFKILGISPLPSEHTHTHTHTHTHH